MENRSPLRKAFLRLHVAVFLAGFTGILGRLISLNEALLVWYRLLFSVITLLVFHFLRNNRKQISRADTIRVLCVGGIAGLHWLSFYGSIKASNVSIALVCFSSIGFFTAFLEPLIFRSRLQVVECLLGILVMAGIYCIFQFDPHYRKGIWIGLLSAGLGSLFPILNRKLLQRIDVETLTLYELAGGFILLSLMLPVYIQISQSSFRLPGITDFLWLILLSWVCTVLAFQFSMSALKKISAFTVNLTYNLEPVCGIALAFLIFREDQSFGPGFYLGFGIIILAIAWQMIRIISKSSSRQIVITGSKKKKGTIRLPE